MGLYNRAYLVCQESESLDTPNQAVFELRYTDYTESVSPNYIMGRRGQWIREASIALDTTQEFEVGAGIPYRRAGYWLDGGGGDWQISLEFEFGLDDVRWGDGDSAEGQANVTRTDASGEGVRPITRLQVLNYWLAQTRSDSFGQTRLHIGEYTDGTFDDYEDGSYVNAEAGAYGSPIPIAINEDVSLSTDADKVTKATGTLNAVRATPFPVTESELAGWLSNIPELQTPLAPIPDA